MGLQKRWTKYCRYLCCWDSRAKHEHYETKTWETRNEYQTGSKNVINPNLVDKSKIIILPLHVKLEFIKQFVKALPKNGPAFLYLFEKFPHYRPAKIGEGIFIGPKIRKLATMKLFRILRRSLNNKPGMHF